MLEMSLSKGQHGKKAIKKKKNKKKRKKPPTYYMKEKTAVFKGEWEETPMLMDRDKTSPKNNPQSKFFDKFSYVQFHNIILKHW